MMQKRNTSCCGTKNCSELKPGELIGHFIVPRFLKNCKKFMLGWFNFQSNIFQSKVFYDDLGV